MDPACTAQTPDARLAPFVDLKTDPKTGTESLDSYVDLVARAVALGPDHVITIKANVSDLTQPKLHAAGLSVSTERVPFPGSSRQRAYEAAMARGPSLETSRGRARSHRPLPLHRSG